MNAFVATDQLHGPTYVFDAGTTYNQWTVFYRITSGFNPESAGLTYVESPKGDIDPDDVLDVADIDILAARIRDDLGKGWLRNAMFDVNNDDTVDEQDHLYWVHNLTHTWLGDANLDGFFNSDDVIDILAADTYEKYVAAGWAEGDFNGSGKFDSDDVIHALADGGYEMGLRPIPVPEPSGGVLLLGAVVFFSNRRRSTFVNSTLRVQP